MLSSLTTHDIKVSVVSYYQDGQSKPEQNYFLFAYKIRIENLGEHAVQLMSREWIIKDANGQKRTVTGEGVVGEQPIIEPGQSHEYISGCHFETPFGTMEGHYFLRKLIDNESLRVAIPKFKLQVHFLLN